MTWHADILWPIGGSNYKRRFSGTTSAEAQMEADNHIEYLKDLYKFNISHLDSLQLKITEEENEMDKLMGKNVLFIMTNGEAIVMTVTTVIGSTIMGEDEGEQKQINTSQMSDYLVMEEV